MITIMVQQKENALWLHHLITYSGIVYAIRLLWVLSKLVDNYKNQQSDGIRLFFQPILHSHRLPVF